MQSLKNAAKAAASAVSTMATNTQAQVDAAQSAPSTDDVSVTIALDVLQALIEMACTVNPGEEIYLTIARNAAAEATRT